MDFVPFFGARNARARNALNAVPPGVTSDHCLSAGWAGRTTVIL